jgi:hypothetical protein
MTYTVKYQAGTYSGTRTVQADDEKHAIAKVRAEIRKNMTLSMYSDSYKVLSANPDDENVK